MKVINTPQWQSKFKHILLVFLAICFTQCSDSGVTEDLESIDDYIRQLEYTNADLLNTMNTQSGNTNRSIKDQRITVSKPNNGRQTTCDEVTYQLDKNFDKISILRPTNGIVWPGALLYGDGELLKGTPRPITLDQSPVTLRVDLPGLQDEGTFTVEDPENSNVQSELNQVLDWWNNNEFQEGYVNPSLSEYQSSVAHTTNQVSMDIGMNVEWASGSVESQLNYNKTTETDVAMLVFKQVFYSVTMDSPDSPGSMFAGNVSLTDVQNQITNDAPPAYVSSVDYGRIIMFKIESKNVSKSISLSAVLEYAAGVGTKTEADAQFDQVLNNSSTNVTVVTIGGNAEVASEAVAASGFRSLNHIITGENAVYGKENPGVPIAYTVHYLKDNSIAKMGYTTDYSIVDCVTQNFVHNDILLKNKFKSRNIRAQVSFKDRDGKRVTKSWQTVKDETAEGEYLADIPSGAHEVRVNIEKWVLFDGWRHFNEYNMDHVDSSKKSCIVAYECNGTEYLRYCQDEHDSRDCD